MSDTCAAVVFLGDGRHELRELPVPSPPPGGAVLRVEAVGLCGSDVAQLQGIQLVPGASAFPVVPGHETVGRVVALAADARLGVSEGERVAVDEILSTAPFRVYGYSDMSGEGRVGPWGGYGEYMEVFAGTRLHRLPDDVPAEQLTLFEPLANASTGCPSPVCRRATPSSCRDRATRGSPCSKRCSRATRRRSS